MALSTNIYKGHILPIPIFQYGQMQHCIEKSRGYVSRLSIPIEGMTAKPTDMWKADK